MENNESGEQRNETYSEMEMGGARWLFFCRSLNSKAPEIREQGLVLSILALNLIILL